MKPKEKKKRVKKPVIAIYLNTSKEFRENFLRDAKLLGLSRSGFANLLIAVGYKHTMQNLDMKKIPSTEKKKMI